MMKYVKITVSLLLIGALLYHVEWVELIGKLESVSSMSIAIAFAIFMLQFPISTLKWQKSLLIHHLDYPFGFLQKVLCIGFFFNNFFPTSIGGDAYRAIKTMPEEGFKSRAVSAILLERLIGIFALLLLGFIGAIVILKDKHIDVVQYYLLICLAATVVLVMLLLILRTGIFSGLFNRINKIKKLEALSHNFNLVRSRPGALGSILVVSLVFQSLAIAAIGVLFDEFGVDGDYAKYAFIAAVVGLAGILPISINGLGVTEGAFAVTATQLGMDFSQAVIVAFMLRILVLPLSLICGIVYLVDSNNS